MLVIKLSDDKPIFSKYVLEGEERVGEQEEVEVTMVLISCN